MTLSHGIEFFEERNEPGDEIRAAMLKAILAGMTSDIPLPLKDTEVGEKNEETFPYKADSDREIARMALGNTEDDTINQNLQPRDYLTESTRQNQRSEELHSIVEPVALLTQKKLFESDTRGRKWYGAQKDELTWQCNRSIDNIRMLYDFYLTYDKNDSMKVERLLMRFGKAEDNNKLDRYSSVEINMKDSVPESVTLRFSKSNEFSPHLIPALSATPALSIPSDRNRILTQLLGFRTRPSSNELYIPREATSDNFIYRSSHSISLNQHSLAISEEKKSTGRSSVTKRTYDPQTDSYKGALDSVAYPDTQPNDVAILTQAIIDLIPSSERVWLK